MRAQRLRVRFSRDERLRYITHLDLMRAWERAIKRAGLPLSYSEGFTPHPQILMAAPLPVGATSEAELMDIYLSETVPVERFAAAVTGQLPAGLGIGAVEETPLSAPSVQSQVREWEWRALLPAATEPVALRGQVAALLARTELPWELRREKEVKQYDLRAVIRELAVEDGPPPALWMRLRAEAGGRPEQVASALGFEPQTVRIHRLALHLAGPAATAHG
jgi:radical SAM-linked protein